MKKPRFNLSTKIALACVLLICAPVALAWAMGIYDQLVARQITGDLDAAEHDLSKAASEEGGAVVDDQGWLIAYAQGVHAVLHPATGHRDTG